MEPTNACPRCFKPPQLCVCAGITPIDTRLEILILQHPQEQDAELGTARLTAAHFRRAAVRVGLSWRNLADAVGHPADPTRWAVLYLGSGKAFALPPGRQIVAVTRKGAPFPGQDAKLATIEGIVLLDGSWSQAKALWWRNPWLLKLTRLVLAPRQPSRYGKLRREARREALSTLEAAALALSNIEGKPEISTALLASFDALLDRYRAARDTRDS